MKHLRLHINLHIRKRIPHILALCFGLMFLFCGGMAVNETADSYRGQKEFARMREQFERASPEIRFPVYASLHQENPDFAGWVSIPDTSVDYPVCHTPDQPDYYLHRDFQGRDRRGGTPYLDSLCSPDDPRANLLIYGHHMKDGTMFAPLTQYTESDWLRQHPYIQFDTLEDAGIYQVAAVFVLEHAGSTAAWQQLLFPPSDEDFDLAWASLADCRADDTGIKLTREDQLLALVTCEYTHQDGRLMVLARKIF